MEDFKSQIKKSFQTCKTDIISNNSEISALKGENQSLKQSLNENQKLLENIQSQIKQLTDLVKSQTNEAIQVPQKQIKSKDPYEALLMFKAKNNKRDILKQKIITMIGDVANLSELKFLFVEHFKYCSKATFYNYLKELELERQIKIERESSKNFIYPLTSNKNLIN